MFTAASSLVSVMFVGFNTRARFSTRRHRLLTRYESARERVKSRTKILVSENKISRTWRRWLLAAALSPCAFLLFFRLGEQPIFGDETLYVRVAGKVLRTDLWAPILNRPYAFVEKPPLAVWGAALGMAVAGVDEFGARWVGVGASLLLCALTAGLALRCGNAWTMALAPLLLASSPGLLLDHGLRWAVPESWLLLSLVAGFSAAVASGEPGSKTRLAPVALASAFSGWTKGLVGPVVLALALFGTELVLALTGQPESGSTLRARIQSWTRMLPRAFAISLAALLPGLFTYFGWLYFSLASLTEVGRFLDRDLLVRASGLRDPNDLQPFSIYLQSAWENFGLLAILGPLLLISALFQRRRTPASAAPIDRRTAAMLLCWIVSVFAIFGTPRARLPWYSFPAYPALAIAGALVLDQIRVWWIRRPYFAAGSRRRWATSTFALLLVFVSAIRVNALRRAWPVEDPFSLMRLQRILDEDRTARAYVDAGLSDGAQAKAAVEEWHRYYLRRFTELPEARLPAEAPSCSFIVTAEPARWRSNLGRPIVAERALAGVRAPKRPLFILDLCAGRFLGRAAESLR